MWIQGLLAGFIGYGVLALVVSIADLISGHSPFQTAAVLGASLFYGLRDPAAVEVLPGYVLAYNGAHLLVFLVLGLIGAALARLADRGQQLWYFSLFFFVFVGFHAMGFVQGLSDGMRGLVPDAVIWIAGIAASAAMAAYLIRVHPALRRTQRWDG